MKISQLVIMLSLSLPALTYADRLIYPEKKVRTDFSSDVEFSISLEKVIEELGLSIDSTKFKFKEVKESLLGKHYYFQQMENDHEVNRAVLVVSVDNADFVSKVYNSSVSTNLKSKNIISVPLITQESAIERAWQELGVSGDLLEVPEAHLVYTSDLLLTYQVKISTSSPFGYWLLTVNALNGEVLSVTDTALPRKKQENHFRFLKDSKKSLVSFSAAMKKVKNRSMFTQFDTSIKLVTGQAQVFNPNPVVTLGRKDLTDSTDASEFLPAYKIEELKEISFTDGVYSLKGPKITLLDFESPYIPPSTSTDGNWIFERKNIAFNDAMTYLHLDRSVRYIESLGFKDDKAIFKKSIEVDANGVNGSDNSHYVPSSRRLAFGHGCVDDNEDTDVILHELGHAIHHHINSYWYGGDTGAMGEGFGDYWAASYSVTTENGLNFHPELVFKWDGHNECWAGRKLNAFEPVYNPARTYSAHSRVDGGISDEIWSTPVFQAFLELYKRGVARSDIDKIILEAHYGMGSGVRMPEMATAIVKTAKILFPAEDYDQVYLKHFQKQNILR